MQNRHIRVVSTLLLVLAIISGPTALRADVTGSILGVVRDRTQAVVAGARIVATNVQTNFKQDTTSAADGSYRILALPAGNYKITATAPGFQQFITTDIDLKVNDQLRIDVTLEVGSMQQEVSVTANAVQVQTESTQLGDVIETKKMLALPLNGRSYLDLLGLQAGVVPGILAERRQPLGKWPARDGQRVPGERRRRERRTQPGCRVGPQSRFGGGIPTDHQ